MNIADLQDELRKIFGKRARVEVIYPETIYVFFDRDWTDIQMVETCVTLEQLSARTSIPIVGVRG